MRKNNILKGYPDVRKDIIFNTQSIFFQLTNILDEEIKKVLLLDRGNILIINNKILINSSGKGFLITHITKSHKLGTVEKIEYKNGEIFAHNGGEVYQIDPTTAKFQGIGIEKYTNIVNSKLVEEKNTKN